MKLSWWLRRQSVYLQCRKPRVNPWVGKILWRMKWRPTPVLLPGKSHGQRSVVGYSPWGHKELDMTERLHFHFSCHEKYNAVMLSYFSCHEKYNALMLSSLYQGDWENLDLTGIRKFILAEHILLVKFLKTVSESVSCSVVSDSLQPHRLAHQDPLSIDFYRKNTGVCCHSLLQGTFSTQG